MNHAFLSFRHHWFLYLVSKYHYRLFITAYVLTKNVIPPQLPYHSLAARMQTIATVHKLLHKCKDWLSGQSASVLGWTYLSPAGLRL